MSKRYVVHIVQTGREYSAATIPEAIEVLRRHAADGETWRVLRRNMWGEALLVSAGVGLRAAS